MAKRRRARYTTGELSFTEKEVEALLLAAPSYEDELIVRMAISTGIRREDLAGILVSNIDLKEGRITYWEEKKDRDRTIPLSPSMVTALNKYLASLPRQRRGAKLFPMTGRTLYNRLQVMCDRAEIPRRPFHSLRATAIKRAQRRGWKPEEVAKLTGDTLEVIAAHYSTPSEAEMAEVMREKELI